MAPVTLKLTYILFTSDWLPLHMITAILFVGNAKCCAFDVNYMQ